MLIIEWFNVSICKVRIVLFQSKHFAIKFFIAACSGKVIKGFFCYPDDMIPDENSAFGGSVFRVFNGAFPFHYSPASIIVCGKFAENAFKIHLSIAQENGTCLPC